MTSALSRVPVPARRRFAATLGLFATLFVAVGVLGLTGSTPAVVRVFAAVALLTAVVLALIAWGTARSIRLDTAAESLDRAIEDAVAEHGSLCGCGVEHDLNEMHVSGAESAADVNAACAGDGHGEQCSHTCSTCVLAALRQ